MSGTFSKTCLGIIHMASTPFCGSMYQKVSMASWCSPVDWPPALIDQILNQPAFLIVPSGFSTISVSLRGRLEIVPWALASAMAETARIIAAMPRHGRIVSSLRCAPYACRVSAVCLIATLASGQRPVNQALRFDPLLGAVGQPKERVLRLLKHEHRLGIEAEIDPAQHRAAHAMAHHDGAAVAGDDVGQRCSSA